MYWIVLGFFKNKNNNNNNNNETFLQIITN